MRFDSTVFGAPNACTLTFKYYDMSYKYFRGIDILCR